MVSLKALALAMAITAVAVARRPEEHHPGMENYLPAIRESTYHVVDVDLNNGFSPRQIDAIIGDTIFFRFRQKTSVLQIETMEDCEHYESVFNAFDSGTLEAGSVYTIVLWKRCQNIVMRMAPATPEGVYDCHMLAIWVNDPQGDKFYDPDGELATNPEFSKYGARLLPGGPVVNKKNDLFFEEVPENDEFGNRRRPTNVYKDRHEWAPIFHLEQFKCGHGYI